MALSSIIIITLVLTVGFVLSPSLTFPFSTLAPSLTIASALVSPFYCYRHNFGLVLTCTHIFALALTELDSFHQICVHM